MLEELAQRRLPGRRLAEEQRTLAGRLQEEQQALLRRAQALAARGFDDPLDAAAETEPVPVAAGA